jgi:hypothetical protein
VRVCRLIIQKLRYRVIESSFFGASMRCDPGLSFEPCMTQYDNVDT